MVQLTDLYFIAITCDHVTVEGRRRTPRIARAVSQAPGEWAFWSPARGGGVRESSKIEMQRLDGATQQPTTEGGVMRYALACEYPGCRFRVVARNEKISKVLDGLRLAGIRSITLPQLGAKL